MQCYAAVRQRAACVRTVVLGMQPTHAVEGLTTVMCRIVTEVVIADGERGMQRLGGSRHDGLFFFFLSFFLAAAIHSSHPTVTTRPVRRGYRKHA